MNEPPESPDTSARRAMLERLSSQDWEELIKELMAYTVSRLQNRSWLGVWSGHLPGGAEARDIVMESVSDIISGVRHADPSVELTAFLKQVIRSKISHLVWSAENRRTQRLDPAPAEKELDKEIADHGPDRDETTTEFVSVETEEINSRLLSLLIDHVSDDPDLQKVLECNLDGVFKREEIAKRMGKSVSEITNVKKRLNRRLETFRKKLAAENPYQDRP
jgi:RNA polymerase sigma factor (sigma-70 family)